VTVTGQRSPLPADGLRREAEAYLAMRRTLGFKLSTQGRLLLGFVAYCERRGILGLTTDAAVAWATATPRSRDALWWARRLMVVRIFARHLQALDPAAEVPPDDVLPLSFRRTTPYLYSPQQLRALMKAAHRLEPRLRAATYATVIGLLAACGLRIGEACRLDRGDVDLDTGVLTVRDAKFGKSRIVRISADYSRRTGCAWTCRRVPARATPAPRHRVAPCTTGTGWTTPASSPTPGSSRRPRRAGPASRRTARHGLSRPTGPRPLHPAAPGRAADPKLRPVLSPARPDDHPGMTTVDTVSGSTPSGATMPPVCWCRDGWACAARRPP